MQQLIQVSETKMLCMTVFCRSCGFHQFCYNSPTLGLHFSLTQLKRASYTSSSKAPQNFSKCSPRFKALSITANTGQRTFRCMGGQCLAPRRRVAFDKDFWWWAGWCYQNFQRVHTKASQVILNFLAFKILSFETFLCLLSPIPRVKIV